MSGGTVNYSGILRAGRFLKRGIRNPGSAGTAGMYKKVRKLPKSARYVIIPEPISNCIARIIKDFYYPHQHLWVPDQDGLPFRDFPVILPIMMGLSLRQRFHASFAPQERIKRVLVLVHQDCIIAGFQRLSTLDERR